MILELSRSCAPTHFLPRSPKQNKGFLLGIAIRSSYRATFVRFLLILGGLNATYQPSLSIPRTAGTGAMARGRLTPRLPPHWLVAQGTLKQMPFLPTRADPNNLLCGSFCLGTQQPPSIHSNVCKQLLPLVSTVMLPEHTLPPAATSTTSCGQTRLHPACSP